MTIRELRKSRKLTQAAMAKDLGVNVSAIGHLENGRMKLSEKLAARVWEVYGVEAEDPAGKSAAKQPVKKPAAKKARTYGCEIIIQSPMGGEITVEQVREKLPEIAETVYVRVDQNKLWWVGGEDSWYVDIWE